MNPRIQFISVLGSLAIMVLVFRLICRRKLREEYALLWLGAGLALIGASIWRSGLDLAARLVGIGYAPSLLFPGSLVLGLLLAIQFSMALSRLADQNMRLAQELAILKASLLERAAERARFE